MTEVEFHVLKFFEGKDTIDLNALVKGLKYEYDQPVLLRAHGVLNGKGFIIADSKGSHRYAITEKGTSELKDICSRAEQSRREREEENASQKELKRLQIGELKYKETIRGLEENLKAEQIKGIEAQRNYYRFRIFWIVGGGLITYVATNSESIVRAYHIVRTWLQT